jgi:hypothetical protein
MGFWDKHIPAPGGPPQHYPATAPLQPRQVAPVQPVPTQYAPEGAVEHSGPELDDETLSAALQNERYQPQKAIAHKTEQGRCPACGSGNWYTGASSGTPVKPHCYDCGYPNVQAGSGMGALSNVTAAGPVRPAMQVQTPNPEPTGF